MKTCPSCGGEELYSARKLVVAGGGYAPNYLPGLGTLFNPERFRIVVCAACGLTSFVAPASARRALRTAKGWRRV